MKTTLRLWQKLVKPKDELIYNASATDGQDGWNVFPIGMAYKFIEYGGSLESAQIGPHNNTVFCAIHHGNDKRRRPDGQNNRDVYIDNLKKHGIKNEWPMDAHNYFARMPSYKFVVSPEGNGIDCHRHYEAFMAGCIPIIEHNDKIKEKYGNMPILYTTDYSEITPEYLEQKYTEMLDKEYDFSPLFLSHYTPEQQQQIKHMGNHWVGCILHRSWY
jgi:hypothetical protein